jgi:hypothetical protein
MSWVVKLKTITVLQVLLEILSETEICEWIRTHARPQERRKKNRIISFSNNTDRLLFHWSRFVVLKGNVTAMVTNLLDKL